MSLSTPAERQEGGEEVGGLWRETLEGENHDCPLGRRNKQLKESEAYIYTSKRTEAAGSCGLIKEKLKEAEEEGTPVEESSSFN